MFATTATVSSKETVSNVALNKKENHCNCNLCVTLCVCVSECRWCESNIFLNHIFLFSVVSALNKAWCVNCFACSTCNSKLTLKWVICSKDHWGLAHTFSPTSHSHFTYKSSSCFTIFFSQREMKMWCYFSPVFIHLILPLLHFQYLLSVHPLVFFFLPSSPSTVCLLSFLPLTLFTPNTPCRDKFVEVDLKPVCKHCYERLPDDMKRRLARRDRDSKDKKKKPLIPMCLWSSFSPFSSTAMFPLWSVPFLLFFLFFLLLFTSGESAQ